MHAPRSTSARPSHPLLPLLAALTLLTSLLPARAARARPGFDALKARAKHLESLGTFLKNYVGVCSGDRFEKRDCQTNVKTARKRFAGKLLHVRLSDRHGRLLQVLRELPSGQLKVGLTPFFDAAGYGLSRGRAPRFDKRGNPRARLLIFNVTLPDDLSARSFNLQLRSGNVNLELLFEARGAWKVRRPGQDAAEGVAARFKGLKLVSARTGDLLGEVTW